MRIKNLNIRAFSLLEILLAAIIFIISIGGVFVTLNAVRSPVADKENALGATIFGKQVLESLRSSVNASTFYSACASSLGVSHINGNGACTDFSLYLGLHQVPSGTLPLTWPTSLSFPNTTVNTLAGCDTGVACLVYTVYCGDGSPNQGVNPNLYCTNPDVARKVNLNINWPDAL